MDLPIKIVGQCVTFFYSICGVPIVQYKRMFVEDAQPGYAVYLTIWLQFETVFKAVRIHY